MVSLKFIETSVLTIGYEEHGDSDGLPIILLHGFPYDIRSWDKVAPELAFAGYRVLVPYLRGYGPTRFLSGDHPQMAEQAAIGQDVIDFAEALDIPQFALAGFDWGNRASCIASILYPERVKGLVAIGGYPVQDTLTRGKPAPAYSEAHRWYQWYFNTDQGQIGLETNRRDIVKYLWDTWSPTWRYSDEDFSRSADSFDNPDFVNITLHSYRHRHMNALGEERFLAVEKSLAMLPSVTVPSIVLLGEDSGFGRPSDDPTEDKKRFANLVARRIVSGAGHDLPVQRPDAVVAALIELLS
jgi:pimeloyl-ACP methyl ester carboxylesterase